MLQSAVTNASRLDRLAPLLQAEPDNLSLHRECVELAMRGREFPRAMEIIDARLARHPGEAESLFARSNALIGLQRFEDAISVLESLEEQGVAPAAVLQNLATCHFALRQYENVRACGERLIAAGEKSGDALQLTVAALHHLGDMEAALKIANEFADVAATHGGFAGACAMAYLDTNEASRAAKYAGIALAQNPDSIDGLLVQATLAASDLENEQAFRQYSRVLEIAPHAGRAWLGLGMLATLGQDFRRACDLLKRATELMPQHVGSWHALGWAHLFAGDTAGAEQHFAHALELDRNFAESHGAMAAMLAMRGARAEAEREIELAERLDRKNMSSQFARAILMGHDNPQASRDFIRDSVRLLSRQLSTRPRQVLEQLLSRQPGPPKH